MVFYKLSESDEPDICYYPIYQSFDHIFPTIMLQEKIDPNYKLYHIEFEENQESKILKPEACMDRWPCEFKKPVLVFKNKHKKSKKRSCKE